MKFKLSLLAVLNLLFMFSSSATHIRGGEIRVVQEDPNSLECKIIFTGYKDSESGVEFGNGYLDFGDGTVIETMPNDFEILEYSQIFFLQKVKLTMTHTFPDYGKYVISYTEQNRNNFILNINNGNSVDLPFYVESMITLIPGKSYESPQFNLDPGFNYTFPGDLNFSMGGYDPNNYKLYYQLVEPKQGKNNYVPNYIFLNNMTINEYNGHLFWNGNVANLLNGGLPDQVEFAIAIKIYQLDESDNIIGYTVRDMQIVSFKNDFTAILSDTSVYDEDILQIQNESDTYEYNFKYVADSIGTIVSSELMNYPNALNYAVKDSVSNDTIYQTISISINYTELTDRDFPYNISIRNFAYYDTSAPYYLGMKTLGYTDKTISLYTNSNYQTPNINEILSVDNEIEKRIFVYPNPARDYLTLPIDVDNNSEVRIYSHTGQEVKSLKLDNSRIANIHDLKSGSYIGIVRNVEGEIKRFKFIKSE
ncbi:T9SS type A sorting domain-containing protein [Marinigracilibium pacificum]|uniref:T9SS type A sorting domain-containing protein n=1 Tax=Marinigracilibium pacificum TaxID=2729599 RepID=A0A848J1Z3_9BACT|nr:T9SS type A sorting domain-containing protein [Marinigracilibium pacificum]NMM48560.1 T9SS type A sorting domain-containing protein [Marinigracilibium pacificum]